MSAAVEEGVPPADTTTDGAAVEPEPQAQPHETVALLPLGTDEFPDEALALVCSFLNLKELGRLACASRRFTEPTLTEPGGGSREEDAKIGGGAKLSPIEEGARLQLLLATASAAGATAIEAGRLEDETWMHALWRATAPCCKYCKIVLPVPGNDRKCTEIASGSCVAPNAFFAASLPSFSPQSFLCACE
eukprot:COSAG02_NODE_15564_length_1159_cov_12.336792_2_plen_190_part_00